MVVVFLRAVDHTGLPATISSRWHPPPGGGGVVVVDFLDDKLHSLGVAVAEVGGPTQYFRTLHAINWDTSYRMGHTRAHRDS